MSLACGRRNQVLGGLRIFDWKLVIRERELNRTKRITRRVQQAAMLLSWKGGDPDREGSIIIHRVVHRIPLHLWMACRMFLPLNLGQVTI